MIIFGIQVVTIDLIKTKGEKMNIVEMKVIERYTAKNINTGIVKKAHVKFDSDYYIVSDNGRETLIFPSNESGQIVSYLEVGGQKNVNIDYVLKNFSNQLWG